MRLLLTLALPVVLQVLLFVGVFVAAQGGGSFMGLLAIPMAALAFPALLVFGFGAARRDRPLGGDVLISWALAIVPPVLLLLFRAVEG